MTEILMGLGELGPLRVSLSLRAGTDCSCNAAELGPCTHMLQSNPFSLRMQECT